MSVVRCSGFMLLLAILGLIAGCGSDSAPATNQPPSAELTHGPVEGSVSFYSMRLAWTGSDPDGYVTHYEVALDPPAAFSETEIAWGGPGITESCLSDPMTGALLRRVSKVVDGESISFDWEITREFSRRFQFSAPDPDSAHSDGRRSPPPRFTGTHAFYVRAVDDDAAVSLPDRVAFGVATVAPETRITRPVFAGRQLVQTGAILRVEWAGADSDAPDGSGLPAAYEYKLVKLQDLDPPISPYLIPEPGPVLRNAAATIPWVRVSAESSGKTLSLEVSQSTYMLGVRSVDAAGVADPFLSYATEESPGNVVLFQCRVPAIPPLLVVTRLGGERWTASGSTYGECQAPSGKAIEFSWSAIAQDNAGRIDAFRYGVNLADPEAEGPDAGWSDWSVLTHPIERIEYRTPGTFHVQVRDRLGVVSMVALSVTPFDAPHDRAVLIVDDIEDTLLKPIVERDEFWQDILTASGRFEEDDLVPEVHRWHSHGRDEPFSEYLVPSRADLGRYRLVIYDCGSDVGYAGSTGLEEAVRRGYLSEFIRDGGQLWITGRLTTAAMTPGEGGVAYPYAPEPGSFAFDFMKLYSDRITSPGSVLLKVHGMKGVAPFPGRPEIFPAMEVNPSTLPNADSGLGDCDLAFHPLLQQTNPDFSGRIDSLYVYRSWIPGDDEIGGSYFDNTLNAIRWHDPDPNREHGRTMWFGFPVHYFHEGQFQETFNRAIDWFREESPGS